MQFFSLALLIGAAEAFAPVMRSRAPMQLRAASPAMRDALLS